ncbi:MAG: AI-2E family transporter [Bacteroidales bacterium]|jgi:predicted PurR-regulated permease PerM|nr:AI-2E family transporter [Bacteroidales bacterium]
MESKKNTEMLAGWIMNVAVLGLILGACWYFRSVLVYILAAFVMSLLGHPLMELMRKIKIRGKQLPDSLLAVITIIVILGVLSFTVTQIIPVVLHIVREASVMNTQDVLPYNSIINQVNDGIRGIFPSLGPKFNVVTALLEQIRSVMSVTNVTSFLGSVASVTAGIAVGVFSIVFISFFFIKDDNLFCKIISALVPDNIEESVEKTLSEIVHLLSRYFLGLVIEVAGVILVDFLGLWLIARIGPQYALGIAFIAGVLNIIPYVGPLIGEVVGVLLCVVLKYGAGIGLGVPIWAFAIIVLGVMLLAQLIDNFVYQPLIYSTSIKSTPLEIFIVLLIAGKMGGTLGLLMGIPVYTVVRVIAARFFYKQKAVRRLMPDIEKENTNVFM